jgi:predicted O-methyltransferase YrrM
MSRASSSPPRISIKRLLQDADALLPAYRGAISGMPRESEVKGVCASEMFFFYAVARPLAPPQILESGRARGESTLALARCFPELPIMSVELDAGTQSARIAEEKLQPYGNVECLYGDSRVLLLARLQAGAAVLIDGPKEFRALKLALKLLRTGKPAVVFLHDFMAGRPERKFLDRHWPGAFFSDDPEFLQRFSFLDDEGRAARDWRRLRHSTFACLPGKLPAPYLLLLGRLVLARFWSLLPEKLGRLFPRRPVAPR